jgi:abortive infection bacteriophage resistance protein
MAKVPYTKRALNYADQLQKLISRGLKIENVDKTLHLLEQISYYRLSGYWYPLLEEPKSEHKFKEGASFETVFQIYLFDRALRKFFQAELEKIEISVRAKIIYEFWHGYDAFWFSDNQHFKSPTKLNVLLAKLGDLVSKSDDDFIKSFNEKYIEPLPPACMILEVSSFGNLSSIYSNLKGGNREKRNIANYYGLDENTFASWLHSFTYLRNLCAHHSRLWNRVMKISPLVPQKPKRQFVNNVDLPNLQDPNNPFKTNTRVYYLLSMVVYLMDVINPNHNVKEKFFDLMTNYPMIDIKSLGFPKDWEKEPFWRQK